MGIDRSTEKNRAKMESTIIKILSCLHFLFMKSLLIYYQILVSLNFLERVFTENIRIKFMTELNKLIAVE